MIAPRLSRRKKALILASPSRAMRLDLERRLAARRETQLDRERAYHARQTRQILSASACDAVLHQRFED